MPSFNFKKLNEGPYAVEIVSGPYAKNTSTKCTFKLVDSRK